MSLVNSVTEISSEVRCPRSRAPGFADRVAVVTSLPR